MKDIYHKRWLESWLSKAVKDEPVVILTGARQVGKSTLLKHALSQWKYFNLDDLDTLERAQRDPHFLLADSHVIIDEVQRAPKILLAIKQVVDESQRSFRALLSGSANLLLMQEVTESLAGRAVVCQLRPFTWGENINREAFHTIDHLFQSRLEELKTERPEGIEDAILQGWMPVVMIERKGAPVWRWLEGYVTSYLERDLRQLSQIEALSDFRRMMQALALRSGQILNQTEIGRDISLSQPTVHRYLNILEASLLLERLPAYAVSRTKRLIKAPKPFFLDSGLTAFLGGTTFIDRNERMWGCLVETAVLHHLKTWCELQTPKAQVYYWRTVSGAEVDFVIERGGELLAIEVKSTDSPRHHHADHLRLFLQEYPQAKAGVIVHLGNEFKIFDKHIFAVPFWALV